jgi:hypothetical protein
MRSIIIVAAAALVLAFTAHADEVRAPVPNTRLANSCAAIHGLLMHTGYTPGRPMRCAQFLATGNVLHTRHWVRG